MEDTSQWFAHTPPYEGGPWHLVREHLEGVRDIGAQLGRGLNLDAAIQIACALHDLGKYGEGFQKRLEGTADHIDHWTIGAWVALSKYRQVEAALSIEGHHIGLQSGARQDLGKLNPAKYDSSRRTLSESNENLLLSRLDNDGINLPSPRTDPVNAPTLANGMLRTRMLFSVLTDADYIDTESHFARRDHGPKIRRAEGLALDVNRAIAALDAHMLGLKAEAGETVLDLREQVSAACVDRAEDPVGVFTLTAPTGTGKTLAMLRFALLHAKRRSLERVIVVLPFLTLIEQTADIYRKIFREFDPNYVLEDHSLARDIPTDKEEMKKEEDGKDYSAKLLSENWDAPIVITTNVRFFEALHHNRPSVCRKLHRIAQSVVLCDEVQTLPKELAIPTLATLASLSKEFNTTILFATATQPAFGELRTAVEKLSTYYWTPTEILPDVPTIFAASARVDVEWRFQAQSWTEIAEEIAKQPGTLVIVNTRLDAANLAKQIHELRRDATVCHLSTNMCVTHRRQTLEKVRRMGVEKTGFLIATQCVEAGVDLDFLQVYRAWAPLDSIAQAAGRCNRHGRPTRGQVVVFLPEELRYPPNGYREATTTGSNLVKTLGDQAVLHNPALFEDFYKKLYYFSDLENQESKVIDAIKSQNYADLAENYQLIKESGTNIVLDIGDSLGEEKRVENQKLLQELEDNGMSKSLMARLRPYTVSIYLTKKHNLPLSPLKIKSKGKIKKDDTVPDWFLMTNPKAYDELLGLLIQEPPDSMNC